MEEYIKCGRCGKRFYSKYFDDGSITHENHTGENHLEIFYSRGEFIKELNLEGDNYCNIKSMSTETTEDIQKCMLLWLEKNDTRLYKEAIKFLMDRRNTLDGLLSSLNDADKRYFTFYYARANRLIKCLSGRKVSSIEKIKSASGRYAYIARTEEGDILLDVESD